MWQPLMLGGETVHSFYFTVSFCRLDEEDVDNDRTHDLRVFGIFGVQGV